MDDLRDRLANRVQLTSDGHKAYLEAVDGAFAGDIDYAMLVKFYGATSKGAKGSPAECIGARKMPISSQWSCSRLPAILQPRLREALLQELALCFEVAAGLAPAKDNRD